MTAGQGSTASSVSPFYGGPPQLNFGAHRGDQLQASGRSLDGANTYKSFGAMFGGLEAPYWNDRLGQKITNFYTTWQEIYKNQEVKYMMILLDTAIAVQAFSLVLSIVAPYIRTTAQVFKYEIHGLNILPAQSTVVGVPERTNSVTKMSFSTSTREYGTECMMPVDVMYAPLENQMRLDTMLIMAALSLSMTFIQVVMIHFATFGVINNYMKNLGYVYKDKTCDASLIEACDRHMFAMGNDGMDVLNRGLDYYLRAIRHPPGRETTFILIPPELLSVMTSQVKVREINDFNAYAGYATNNEANPALVGLKSVYRMPPGSQNAFVPLAGNGTVFLVVPRIPISPRMSLPHVLNSVACVSQYYYIPQRHKLSHDVGPQKNELGVYSLMIDDFSWIKPSEILVNCGFWDKETGHFTQQYHEALKRFNSKGMPSTHDNHTRTQINGELATHKDYIQRADFRGEMPFTTYNEDLKREVLAGHIHEISPSVFPNAQCLEGARTMEETFPHSADAIEGLMDLATEALDTPPSPEMIDWVIKSNLPALSHAGPTSWHTSTTTHGGATRDVGSLTLTVGKEFPKGIESIVGGFAHSLDTIAGLRHSLYGEAMIAKGSVEHVATTLSHITKHVTSKEPFVHSDVCRRVPAWKRDQKDTATALISQLKGGIPLWLATKSNKETSQEARRVYFLNHSELTTALPERDSAKKNPGFTYRFIVWDTLNKAGKAPANENEFHRVDYVIAKSATKYLARTRDQALKEIVELYEKEESKAYTLNYEGNDATLVHLNQRVKDYSKMANRLAQKLVAIGAEAPPEGFYESLMQAAATGKSVSDAALGLLASLKITSDPVVAKEFATIVENVAGLDKDIDKSILKWVRTPLALSKKGCLKLFSRDDSTADKIRPGDWGTYYSTPLTGTNAAIVEALNSLPDEAISLQGFGNIVTKGSKLSPAETSVSVTPGYDEDEDMDSDEEGGEDESLAKKSKPKKTGAPESTDAWGMHLYKKPQKLLGAASGTVDPTSADVYQTAKLSPSSLWRFKTLGKQCNYGFSTRLLWLLHVYLHTPTNLFAISSLANAGIWYPGDGIVFRNMLFETWSLIILTDGCSRAIINPSRIAQAANSHENEWKMKMTIGCGVAPVVLDGLFNARHAFVEKNICGMTTDFVQNPQDYKITYSRFGQYTNRASLFGMVVNTTDDIGDYFSWRNQKVHEDALRLSRAENAKCGPRRPVVIEYFYRYYYRFMDATIKMGSDSRLALTKTFYNVNGPVLMNDFEAALRNFANNNIISDIWFNGPRAHRTSHQKVIQTFSGFGPLSDKHHQSTDAKYVYTSRQYYFNSLGHPRTQGRDYA